MSKICQRHIVKPVKIYSQCVGCELESLKKEKYQLVMQVVERNAEIAELKEENERLQREIKRWKNELRDEVEFQLNGQVD